MSRATNLLLGFAVIIVVAALVAAGDKGRNVAVVGIWRGELDNLPAVTLNITDEAGPLQGAMLFYLIRRDEVNRPHHPPEIPEPLFNPQFHGQQLHSQSEFTGMLTQTPHLTHQLGPPRIDWT